MLHLLFMVAFVDTPADLPVLPARPPAVVAAPAPVPLPVQQVVSLPPEGGKLTDGPVACNQPLGCGTSEPQPAIRIDTLDGFTAEVSAAWDSGAVAHSPEYSAHLDAELCAAKPVFC